MKILVIDGPGAHPKSSARALGAGLRLKGHAVVVHPLQLQKLGWFKRHGLEKYAATILSVHEPDIVHVFSSEPWVADGFSGRGVPVIHSTLDRASRADWNIAPTQKALERMGGRGPRGDNRASVLPFPIEIGTETPEPGEYVLACAGRKDRKAKAWITEAASAHRDIPLRFEGDPAQARFVISMSSVDEIWPAAIAEAMAAGRAVIAGWNGSGTEFVLEGVTGFLSAPGDVKSLSTHLRYLWDQPEEAAKMGLAGRDEAVAHFGGEELARTLLRLYLRAGVSRLAV